MLSLCVSALQPLYADRASAHELLPQALVEYMETHPDATAEELSVFLDAQPDLTNGDATYKEELIETVFAGDAGFWHNAYAFVVLGIEHILAGLDHILFVLALLLTFSTLRCTLKSITAFTIAHSVTLILAGSNILVLSSRVVEPIIAFSIAFVAIGTVFFRHLQFFSSMKTKVSMIFLFGLFHGLGFAGVLKAFAIPQGRFVSSLLFFNVGIELGQILIILVCLPMIYALRKKSWYPTAIKWVAGLISLVAIVWFLERVLEFKILPV